MALLTHRVFQLGIDDPFSINFGNFDNKLDFAKSIKYHSNYLSYLNDIKNTLSILKIKEELQLDNISDIDKRYIDLIVTAILHNKPQKLILSKDLGNSGSFKKILTISNISILFIFEKESDGKYMLHNFFVDRLATVIYKMSDTGNLVNAPIYLTLTTKDLISAHNIDYDTIFDSFLQFSPTEDFFTLTTIFILNLLHAYDKSKKNILLETTLRILSWFIDNGFEVPQEIFVLNKLQTIKRMRILSDSEKNELLRIVSGSTEDKILVGAHLLLDDKEKAKYHFKKLRKKDKKEFLDFPISIFWADKLNLF